MQILIWKGEKRWLCSTDPDTFVMASGDSPLDAFIGFIAVAKGAKEVGMVPSGPSTYKCRRNSIFARYCKLDNNLEFTFNPFRVFYERKDYIKDLYDLVEYERDILNWVLNYDNKSN